MACIQRPTDECLGTALVEQLMRKALLLPTGPRSDALLDVYRKISQVMPKLNNRSGRALCVSIVHGVLIALALNQLSDEFRALSMVPGAVGVMLHLSCCRLG